MPKQTVTIEIDVPDGYECCEYRRVKEGEICMTPTGTVFEWPGGAFDAGPANDANYFILRKLEPEKPQIHCFEIDWDHSFYPTKVAVGRYVDGYRIVGFTSTPDDPLNYDSESCHFDPLSMTLIKHTHAVGVLDEE